MTTYSAVASGAAGSATLPIAGVYSSSTAVAIIREIKVFNVGSLAARIRIVRLTSAGTWTAVTEAEYNEAFAAPTCTGVHTASGTAPTIATGDLDVAAVGAGTGSGFYYTYYGEGRGLWTTAGTSNGIGIIETADTVNTYDVAIVWDE